MRTVVEFKVFMRLAEGRLADIERKALVDAVAAHPDAGDIMPGGGGARKFAHSGDGEHSDR